MDRHAIKKSRRSLLDAQKKAAGKANVELAVPAAYDSDDYYPRDTYEPSDVLMINLSPSLTKKGT